MRVYDLRVYNTLKQAIDSVKPCLIAKANEPSRKICPYRLGNSAKGEMNVSYYQYGGYTSRATGLQPDGSSANWRCAHVADICQAAIINEKWHEPLQKPKKHGPCVADPPDAEVDH